MWLLVLIHKFHCLLSFIGGEGFADRVCAKIFGGKVD